VVDHNEREPGLVVDTKQTMALETQSAELEAKHIEMESELESIVYGMFHLEEVGEAEWLLKAGE
jgi:hypothetical protein